MTLNCSSGLYDTSKKLNLESHKDHSSLLDTHWLGESENGKWNFGAKLLRCERLL